MQETSKKQAASRELYGGNLHVPLECSITVRPHTQHICNTVFIVNANDLQVYNNYTVICSSNITQIWQTLTHPVTVHPYLNIKLTVHS
jgi:hypothetical protein